MSGFLSFAIRKNGHVDLFATSSGSLHHLYDPKIYAGQEAALTEFTDRARVPPTEYRGPVPLAPWNYGIVVLDFDTKQQWDLQIAREMRALSGSFDYSWMHFQEWLNAGWLGTGLVDPRSGEVVHPFPASKIGDWYENIRDEHFQRVCASSTDSYTSAEAAATSPQIRISPAGWELSSFVAGEKAGMLKQLMGAGFVFSPADLAAWRDWTVGQKPVQSADYSMRSPRR